MKKIDNVTPSPLFRDDGPLGDRIIRRARGITLEIIAFILVTVLLPVLLIGAAVVDLVLWLRRRKPWVGVRLTAFLWWFLFGEMRALATILFIWVSTGGPFGIGSMRRRVMLYRLRARWAASHLGGIRVLFGLRFEIEGLDQAEPGPDDHHDAPRVDHRQHASRLDGRPHARHRPSLRDQARAPDDPDDRHRRALGADELRPPGLGRLRGRDQAGSWASPKTSARAKAS